MHPDSWDDTIQRMRIGAVTHAVLRHYASRPPIKCYQLAGATQEDVRSALERAGYCVQQIGAEAVLYGAAYGIVTEGTTIVSRGEAVIGTVYCRGDGLKVESHEQEQIRKALGQHIVED